MDNKQQNWQYIYNRWKAEEWPECPDVDKVHQLPDWIKNELRDRFKCSLLEVDRKVFKTKLAKFSMFYQFENDGGGTTVGQEFVFVITGKYPDKKFKNCLDWCSGSGLIGYSILEHNLCENLVLVDFWEPALSDAEYTKNHLENNLQDKVKIVLLQDLFFLHDSYKFDLIVANPPYLKEYKWFDDIGNRICTDLNWKSHQNFFANIKKNLSPDGVILLQENYQGSSVADFEKDIEANDLVITDTFSLNEPIYYIEIRHR
jgi:16S rRNA G966 N2-methylase RsmD